MKPAEFANGIGVSEQALRNWDNSGKLIAKRMKTIVVSIQRMAITAIWVFIVNFIERSGML